MRPGWSRHAAGVPGRGPLRRAAAQPPAASPRAGQQVERPGAIQNKTKYPETASIIFQRISFETEIPSGASQAGDPSQKRPVLSFCSRSSARAPLLAGCAAALAAITNDNDNNNNNNDDNNCDNDDNCDNNNNDVDNDNNKKKTNNHNNDDNGK